MHLRIDSNMENPFLNAARFIVNEFVHDNPNALNDSDINKRIEFLADQFSKTYEAAPTNYKIKYFDIEISDRFLPADMKLWALSKQIFKIKAPHLDGFTSKISDTDMGEMQLPAYTFANQDWSDVKFVKKTNEGQRGAWFYVNPQRGSVVVKGQEDAEKQLMGTVFLRGMNINAPDAKLVERRSFEGKQLSSLGEANGLNFRNPTHYIVMNRVMGPSYNNLSSSDENIQLIKSNLQNFGELAVYDLVLGNFDRFQLDSSGFNAGNIMFENDVLHPIDTDCIYDEEKFEFSKAALKRIIEGKGTLDDKIARKLAANLGGGVRQDLFPADKIKEGMDKAIIRLVEFSKNMDLQKGRFIDSCQERGGELTHFPKYLEELLLHIVKCHNQVEDKK
jgi:hypothetical protein